MNNNTSFIRLGTLALAAVMSVFAFNLSPGFAQTSFSGGGYSGIDTLRVGAPSPPPCNLPPVPVAGQNVTWRADESPYEICTDLLIPEGGTVNVEPGVEVQVWRDHSLTISGTLTAEGDAAGRVRFAAPAVFPPALIVAGGTLDLRFTDVRGQLRPGSGGTILLSDCTFADDGLIFTVGGFSRPGFIRIERCEFTNTSLGVADSWAVLRDVTLRNTGAQFLRGYTLVQGGVTADGRPLSIIREENIQPLYVDGIAATNVAFGGGLNLEGGNYLLGPNNVLENNLYPVDIRGGLLPGSFLPLTGNINDMIWAHEGGSLGLMHWAHLGLPYLVTGFINGGGSLTIDPGATVQFAPSPSSLAGLTVVSTRRLIADGLPDAPITFEALDPANPWDGLLFQTNGTEGSRLEYTVFRGAKLAVSTDDNLLEIQNSQFENNQRAVNANTFGTAKLSNTRLFQNGIGVQVTGSPVSGGNADLHAPNLPNWFEGNAAAVENLGLRGIPAAENYWGDPSGPRHPLNPDGRGDPITGAGARAVSISPFLTAPPDRSENPPVVRMVEPGVQWSTVFLTPDFTLEPGSPFIVHWELLGNPEAVVEQRILLSPEGPYFGGSISPIVLVDHLPPDLRAYEITVPDVGFAVTNLPQFLRVVAVDYAGREGWDQTPLVISSGRITGDIRITSNYAGQTFIAGSPAPAITWEGRVSSGQIEKYIFLEADGSILGGPFGLPFVSTDTARQVIRVRNNSNDIKWFLSDHYFSIRLDPRLGLTPPAVQLRTPAAGDVYPSAGVVPITWEASAEQGLYSFDIQYSLDGGLMWHPLVVNLPGDVRRYDWSLPTTAGVPDARVRVIARDRRFQNSSDGAGQVFAIVR